MFAESDVDGAVTGGDLVGGRGGDPGQLLSVEQQQAAGGPVGGIEGFIVQQSGGQGPPLVGAGGGAGVGCRSGNG
ncbi:hypothetical protein [Mycobacterium riyadhense]|uniref:hypothetical protein n=1 Tax=Mycobacterium riyadhense TaxID=486698 RepID=UPI00195D562C|nr:hypothetical protein [Mycobacterium riyadhense]